jgi:hypothetical protein
MWRNHDDESITLVLTGITNGWGRAFLEILMSFVKCEAEYEWI